MIRVRVRDISFDALAAIHRVDLNWRYRDGWEALRGKVISIEVPDLGDYQHCTIGGRVWRVNDLFCESMCEHQLEIGD